MSNEFFDNLIKQAELEDAARAQIQREKDEDQRAQSLARARDIVGPAIWSILATGDVQVSIHSRSSQACFQVTGLAVDGLAAVFTGYLGRTSERPCLSVVLPQPEFPMHTREIASLEFRDQPASDADWGRFIVRLRAGYAQWQQQMADKEADKREHGFNNDAYRLRNCSALESEQELDAEAARLMAAWPDRLEQLAEWAKQARVEVARCLADKAERQRWEAERDALIAEEAAKREIEERETKSCFEQARAVWRDFTACRITQKVATVNDDGEAVFDTDVHYSLTEMSVLSAAWPLIHKGKVTPTLLNNIHSVEKITVEWGDRACCEICAGVSEFNGFEYDSAWFLPEGVARIGGVK